MYVFCLTSVGCSALPIFFFLFYLTFLAYFSFSSSPYILLLIPFYFCPPLTVLDLSLHSFIHIPTSNTIHYEFNFQEQKKIFSASCQWKYLCKNYKANSLNAKKTEIREKFQKEINLKSYLRVLLMCFECFVVSTLFAVVQ